LRSVQTWAMWSLVKSAPWSLYRVAGIPYTGPLRVGLAPDRLPQGQRRLHRGWVPQRHRIAGDHPGISSRITVNHGRTAVPDASTTITSSSVWSACLIALACNDSGATPVEVVAVHIRVVIRHCQQATIQAPE